MEFLPENLTQKVVAIAVAVPIIVGGGALALWLLGVTGWTGIPGTILVGVVLVPTISVAFTVTRRILRRLGMLGLPADQRR